MKIDRDKFGKVGDVTLYFNNYFSFCQLIQRLPNDKLSQIKTYYSTELSSFLDVNDTYTFYTDIFRELGSKS